MTANARSIARVLAVATVLALALSSGGCRGAYLARLAFEEARFLGNARPAAELLATADTPARRRALEVLLDVREFAASEGLHVGGSYRTVADTASASPFHVVTAAYVDRLEPFTWWYPVVGSIPYRGYFDRGPAEHYAATLRKQGLDTMIVEASAYSTLGWFDDPLPSHILDRGEGAVVVTVLHELVHQTYFAPGEVEFNETLATAVSLRLAERYYASRGMDDRAAKAKAAREAWVKRSEVLDAASDKLKVFFEQARANKDDRERMMKARAEIYAEILSDIRQVDSRFADDLDSGVLDNASFLAAHRYAMGGRAIDDFIGSAGSVSAALESLRHENPGANPPQLVAGASSAVLPLAEARP